MHAVAPLIDESSGESPMTVEYPGNGVVHFNAAIRVAIKRYNHAVTWATRHFISLISISKKYESNFKEISKLHLLVVIYECTSGQRKHRLWEIVVSTELRIFQLYYYSSVICWLRRTHTYLHIVTSVGGERRFPLGKTLRQIG